jgi:hypothetical protein
LVLAPLAGQVLGHARLDLDHRDAVGQRIVQLAGDSQPFFHGPAPGHLVPGPLGFFGPLLDLAEVQLPGVGGHTHDAHGHYPSGRVELVPAVITAHVPKRTGPVPAARRPKVAIAAYFPGSTRPPGRIPAA